MKQKLRKPTRAEKEIMTKAGLIWKEWLVETVSDSWIVVVRKVTKEKKVLPFEEA